jgi:hypothetical protein
MQVLWPTVWREIQSRARDAVAEMESTQQLTEASKVQIQNVCKSVLQESR